MLAKTQRQNHPSRRAHRKRHVMPQVDAASSSQNACLDIFIKALLKKLGMRSRVEAAIWVTQNGK
ncbi:MAG: hypothetical protein JKY01_08385 [Pseudomonadales bacterium]|nr:hypothetical protein [Pseudomonadales bacterium]